MQIKKRQKEAENATGITEKKDQKYSSESNKRLFDEGSQRGDCTGQLKPIAYDGNYIMF